MKKILIALLSLFTTCTLHGLPIGNPCEPAYLNKGIWFSGRECDSFLTSLSGGIGYYGDFVFNRNLQIRSGAGLDQGRVINDTRLTTNAAYLFLNLCGRLEAFGTLGKSRLQIHTRESSWFLAGVHDGTLFTSSYFSWSIGGRALLLNWRCFSLGIEGQYFSTNPDLSKYLSEGFVRLFTYFTNAHTHYSEWQVGGALSYTIKTKWPDTAVIPYIGFKGSRLHFTTNNFTFNDATAFGDTLTIFDLSAHKNYGYAVGTTLIFGSQIGITVEGRFADERAVHVKSQICF